MISGLGKIDVLTLFVEDLEASRVFYGDVFGAELVYQDDVSAVFKLSNLLINVLAVAQASTLVELRPVGGADSGSRSLLTIEVDDVDAVCAELRQHGIELLNGPIDRPWGRRTAAFADPAGTMWEVAQIVPE